MRPFASYPNEFQQLRNGAYRALKFFFNQYGLAIYMYLFWKCGDEYTAKSLTADVFEMVWQLRSKIGKEDHLIGFLFITAYHRCLSQQQGDTIRWKAEAEAALSAEEAYFFLDDPEMLEAKILSATKQALDKLPQQQRNVLQKLYMEGKSIQAVAVELERHPQTIRIYHSKALYSMRQQLSGLEFLLVAMGLLLSRDGR